MLNIGFDAKRLFNNFTGLGNYSRSLVEGIKKYYPEHSLHLFTPKDQNKADTAPFYSDNYKIISPQSGSKNWWRTSKCTKDIINHNIDIYHGLSHELPLGIEKTNTRTVVTIHDLIYKTYPKDFSIIDRKIYDFKFKHACNKADKVIAVSNSTKSDLIKLYNLNPDKIAVCYQTCNDMFKTQLEKNKLDQIIQSYNLPENFMLYVGSIIERKNLLGIIKAMQLVKTDLQIPLVVIGKGNKYLNLVKKYIHEHKLENLIIFVNNLHYLHLPALYQKAKLFIYPSQYEGFGIPIIESLWSKTPVITSNLSSLPEAAGPGAFYCDPKNIVTLKIGIEKVLSDTLYSEKLITEGYEHIQKFSSMNTTEELMKVYNELMS